MSDQDNPSLKPRLPIRRFDVFAEYSREKAMEDGMAEDEAAGYGLWVAKVVASRRYGAALSQPYPKGEHGQGEQEKEEQAPKPKWHSLGGEPQTDEMFDKEIVRRMGRDFYDKVFRPAIEEAVSKGQSYNSIRDTLRRNWKP